MSTQKVMHTPVQPIDMVLYCPACGMQHIDAPESKGPLSGFGVDYVDVWDNPPHRSHLCHRCNYVWRPADVPTNGVAAVKTKGKNDSPIAQPVAEPNMIAVEGAVWEDGSVSLIRRGSEDERCARKGGERLYRLTATTQPPVSQPPNCAGDPGECAYNGACMYACGSQPVQQEPATIYPNMTSEERARAWEYGAPTQQEATAAEPFRGALEAARALEALVTVVTTANRRGMAWGDQFGPLMNALGAAQAALAANQEVSAKPPEVRRLLSDETIVRAFREFPSLVQAIRSDDVDGDDLVAFARAIESSVHGITASTGEADHE